MSDQPMLTPPGANVRSWKPIGAPRRLELALGPDLIDFRIARESRLVDTVGLHLHDPDSNVTYAVRALISDYCYDKPSETLTHVVAELAFETLNAQPMLTPWQHFCFYGYHWPTGICPNNKAIWHHVR